MDGHKERDTHEDPDTKNAGQTLAKLFNDVSWKPINDCTIGCTTSLNPGLPPVTRSGEPAQRDCVFLTTKMNSLRAMYTEESAVPLALRLPIPFKKRLSACWCCCAALPSAQVFPRL
jgi:hypothetical protein